MAENYFEYIKERYGSAVIKNVCKKYPVMGKLAASANTEWENYSDVLKDSELLYSIADIFRSKELLGYQKPSKDYERLYDRCETVQKSIRRIFRENGKLDYDQLFDSIVDLCWLIASFENSSSDPREDIILLSNMGDIPKCFANYMDWEYERAIEYHNRSVYIQEAIDYKKEKSIITRLQKEIYKESWQYIREGWTKRDLEQELWDCRNICSRHLTRYYCFTVTMALAEKIRRTCR